MCYGHHRVSYNPFVFSFIADTDLHSDGPDEENEDQQLSHTANEGWQPSRTTSAVNTQQDRINQHRQPEMDPYR